MTIYIRCIYGYFGREITKYTVIYGIYIRCWPTLDMKFAYDTPQGGGEKRLQYAVTEATYV
jgi:hypothetical protein